MDEDAPLPESEKPLPTLPMSVCIPDPISIAGLAALLGLKCYEVLGILVELNLFLGVNTLLDFKTASALCALLGVTATKAV
jgi:hypothetical protein